MSYLRSQDEMREAADSLPISHDPEWESKFPAIYCYLTQVKDPQGRRRVLSTLNLSLHEGAWKANLNDRHSGYSLFVTADTVEGAIEALEAALKAPRPAWRKNPWQQDTPQKKKGN